MNYINRIIRAIDFIEKNLLTELQLKDIAAEACYSPYHFHRLFHAFTGECVKVYIRKRRLTEASYEILNTHKYILEIAIKYQFETQESFTRSFKKIYGVTPGKYRQSKKDYKKLHKNQLTITKLIHYMESLTMEPKFKKLGELKTIGMSTNTTMENNKIPQLWADFLPRMGEVENQTNMGIALGICVNETGLNYSEFKENTEFTEIAAVEVSNFDKVPEGMVTRVIRPNDYAVFTHKGSLQNLNNTYDYIYGVWLPNSNFEVAESDDFELYDQRFRGVDDPESEMDIYIPIKEK